MRMFFIFMVCVLQQTLSIWQEKVQKLTLSFLNGGAIFLLHSDYWQFHTENDPAYMLAEIDTSGWHTINSRQLTEDLTDENNRLLTIPTKATPLLGGRSDGSVGGGSGTIEKGHGGELKVETGVGFWFDFYDSLTITLT